MNPPRARLRLAAVTSYFPTSSRRYNGTSAVQTLRALTAHADVHVFCPIAVYPRWRVLSPRGYEREDPGHGVEGFRTTYVEYSAIAGLSRPFNGLSCAARLLPPVRASAPDLILNYWLYPDGDAAVRVGRRLGIPVIVGAIGSDLRTRTDPMTRYLVRRTLRAADAVIAVSDDLRRLSVQQGAAPDHVTTVRNGCDQGVFHPGDRADARRDLSVPDADEVILFVGALIRSKGVDELVRTFIGLARARETARLVVVGKGEDEATLRRQIVQAGLQERVCFAGYLSAPRVAQWMRAADVLCLPSHSEGCPNVVIEALACGIPVVATRVGGIPELVDATCGVLVDTLDPAELHAALVRALSARWDPAQIARKANRDWRTVADETLAICHQVLERREWSRAERAIEPLRGDPSRTHC